MKDMSVGMFTASLARTVRHYELVYNHVTECESRDSCCGTGHHVSCQNKEATPVRAH
jgi:hypothetical protein